MRKRELFNTLLERIKEKRRFIQVLLGPRQVGKTTLALQLEEVLHIPCHSMDASIITI